MDIYRNLTIIYNSNLCHYVVILIMCQHHLQSRENEPCYVLCSSCPCFEVDVARGLLHLLFGVLRIVRTLMEWNGTEHDHMTVRNCSGYTNFKVGAARPQHVTRFIFT